MVNDDDDANKWRDRAKERREGGDADYAESEQITMAAGLHAVPPPGQEQGAGISIEASKYLGGDMEHPHLVKGLDFALLNKVLHL